MTRNQRVKQVRLALGLSQPKFAEAIAISKSYMAEIELGNRTVNERMIKLTSLTFQVRGEWLRSGEGEMFQGSPDPLEKKAMAAFKALEPKYQECFLQQVEQLLVIQKRELEG